jgi:hypothetical protein
MQHIVNEICVIHNIYTVNEIAYMLIVHIKAVYVRILILVLQI